MSKDECSRTAMEKAQKGQANTGPVRNRGPQRARGNATKNGEVFGKWQKPRSPKSGK